MQRHGHGSARPLTYAKDGCYLLWHKFRVCQPGEIDEPHAIREVVCSAQGNLQCMPRLATASSTDQRKEPGLWRCSMRARVSASRPMKVPKVRGQVVHRSCGEANAVGSRGSNLATTHAVTPSRSVARDAVS